MARIWRKDALPWLLVVLTSLFMAQCQSQVQAQTQTQAANTAKPIVMRGSVVDPDGKPNKGASLCLVSSRPEDRKGRFVARAISGEDGKFQFSLTANDWETTLGPTIGNSMILVAIPTSHGPDWVEIKEPVLADSKEWVLKLARDDVPIEGRIVDGQGRPIAGARAAIRVVYDDGGDLSNYLTLVRNESYSALRHDFAKTFEGSWPGSSSEAITDADGRFKLRGVGRERLIWLAFAGPNVGHEQIAVMTRDGSNVSSRADDDPKLTIQSSKFEHVMPLGRIIAGTVLDKQTGKPIAGMEVRGLDSLATATTDSKGRYALTGFSQGHEHRVIASPVPGQPYFATTRVVEDLEPFNQPLKVDFECVKGLEYQLRLTNKTTGEPVRGAEVSYYPVFTNPNVADAPGYAPIGSFGAYNTAKEVSAGVYTSAVLPGPGALAVRVPLSDRYQAARVDPEAFFRKVLTNIHPRAERLYGDLNSVLIAAGVGEFAALPQDQFQAILLINPEPNSKLQKLSINIVPDTSRTIQAIGADGRAVAASEIRTIGAWLDRQANAWKVSGLAADRSRDLWLFSDRDKQVGRLEVKSQQTGSLSIPMQPWAVLTGRVIQADGKPRQGVTLRVTSIPDSSGELEEPGVRRASLNPRQIPFKPVTTDANGHFRVEGLATGHRYTITLVGNQPRGDYGPLVVETPLKPGETKDLGDVRPASSVRDKDQEAGEKGIKIERSKDQNS